MSEEPEDVQEPEAEQAEPEELEVAGVLADPQPGIYEGLSYDDYAVIPAINFSKLRRFVHTAAHARWYMDNPPEETKALRFGHLMHAVLLEPQKLDEQFMVMPKVDKRTKKGKAMWADAQIQAKGRTIVTDEEMLICENIRHNVSQHPTARELLFGQGGANELSVVWRDEPTNMLCKARYDRVGTLGTGQAVLGDAKSSAKVATLRNWQRSCWDYGYHEQAAMYLAGAEALFPLGENEHRQFLWVVIEKDPPNLIRVFEADYDALEVGMQEFRKHLEAYAECVQKGEYPGWDQGIEVAGLPAWAQKTFDAQL